MSIIRKRKTGLISVLLVFYGPFRNISPISRRSHKEAHRPGKIMFLVWERVLNLGWFLGVHIFSFEFWNHLYAVDKHRTHLTNGECYESTSRLISRYCRISYILEHTLLKALNDDVINKSFLKLKKIRLQIHYLDQQIAFATTKAFYLYMVIIIWSVP